MTSERIILTKERFKLTIDRLCYQLMEKHGDFSNSCLIGIQPKGVFMANRIHRRLKEILNVDVLYGKLDVTFYRDDFRTREAPLSPNPTDMEFLVEDKKVILIDDVLYSGRTVRAALTALQHYGRAEKIEMMAMIDRRFNRQLPIGVDYIGMTVDALDKAYVRVEWDEVQGMDQVKLFADKP